MQKNTSGYASLKVRREINQIYRGKILSKPNTGRNLFTRKLKGSHFGYLDLPEEASFLWETEPPLNIAEPYKNSDGTYLSAVIDQNYRVCSGGCDFCDPLN